MMAETYDERQDQGMEYEHGEGSSVEDASL